jgi:hypothetical protein
MHPLAEQFGFGGTDRSFQKERRQDQSNGTNVAYQLANSFLSSHL